MKFAIKTFILILCFALVLSLLAGCENENDLSEYFNWGKAEKLSPVTLTFYFGGYKKPDTRKVLDVIEERLQGSLNVKLDFNWTQHHVDLYGMALEGADMDAFQAPGNERFGVFHVILARSGRLKDITTLLPTYAPNLFKLYDTEELNIAKLDGKLYVLPAHFPTSYRLCAIVREDLKRLYDIPDIKTFEDYEVYLDTIKRNNPGIIPGKINGPIIEILPYCYEYVPLNSEAYLVYKWDDPEMKVMALEDTPEFMEYLKMIKKWEENGYLHLHKSYNTLKTYPHLMNETYHAITTGTVSSFISNESRFGRSVEAMVNEMNIALRNNTHNPDAELKAYILYPENKRQRINHASSQYDSRCFAFMKNSDNVERALMFLDWIYSSQENYDLFMYGIEGEHYVKYGDVLRLPQGTTMAQNRYIGWDGSFVLSNIEFERFFTPNPKQDKEKYIEQVLENSSFAPHEGFYMYLESEDLKTIAHKRFVEFLDFDIEFLRGERTLKSVETFIKALKSYGTDTLVYEVQRQLDEWREQSD